MENPPNRLANSPASRSASIVPAITFERLRRVAREARPLLPLVVLALREERIPASDDLAAELRRLCLRSGLEPASWRYLLRHGVTWLRPVWLVTPEPHGTDASIDVLLAFAAAGHPPPPTAALLRGWMIAAHEPEFGGAFTGVPPAVLAILCASDRTIASPAARNDQDLVLAWAAAVRPRLDKHQRRAGWPWLVERARAWARNERLPPPPGDYSPVDSWPTPLCRARLPQLPRRPGVALPGRHRARFRGARRRARRGCRRDPERLLHR